MAIDKQGFSGDSKNGNINLNRLFIPTFPGNFDKKNKIQSKYKISERNNEITNIEYIGTAYESKVKN